MKHTFVLLLIVKFFFFNFLNLILSLFNYHILIPRHHTVFNVLTISRRKKIKLTNNIYFLFALNNFMLFIYNH